MMDMALGFWVALAMLIGLEGLGRPRLHLLLAIPLGAAILTKSLLGLLPLAVLGACALVSATWRGGLRNPWAWIGVLFGLLIGASWTLHQTLEFGPAVLRVHYLEQVGLQVTKPLSLWGHLVGFPIHLLERFHPAILPAIFGAVLVTKRVRASGDGRLWLLLLWPLVPLILYSTFGAQLTRYLFPLFTPIAILAAWALETTCRGWPFSRAAWLRPRC
jgi:4-amino-4-deoxy-L-arabinose transferase-like glycosyltransferase